MALLNRRVVASSIAPALATLALILGCQHKRAGALAGVGDLAGVDGSIVVTGRGSDRPGAICQSFRLTNAHAELFFARARPITPKELHDEYEYMPCWVEGTMTSAGKVSKWIIRPMGIGEIRRPNGTVELRGCKTCDDLFK